MRSRSEELFKTNYMVDLKNDDWLSKQRIAGKVVAECLNYFDNEVKNKTSMTPLQLSKKAEEIIADNQCTATFKNHDGFPEAVCISVNKELVHGVPKEIPLEEGDVVSFDLGATYKGAIADSAITVIFGQPKSDLHVKVVQATEEALSKGILNINVGKRLGCIGSAIFKSAKGNGFANGVVTNYGGHGLKWNEPHAKPFVANKADPQEGIRIHPGLTIAIEPMLVLDSCLTFKGKDGHAVMTKNIGAHFEQTIFVHEDHVEIMTWRGTEKYLKNNKIYFKEDNENRISG